MGECTGLSEQSLTFLSWAWTQLYFRHLNFSSKGKEKERTSSLPTTRPRILNTASRKRCLKDFKTMILFTSHKLVYNSVNTMGTIGSGRWHHPFFIQELCHFCETATDGTKVSLGICCWCQSPFFSHPPLQKDLVAWNTNFKMWCLLSLDGLISRTPEFPARLQAGMIVWLGYKPPLEAAMHCWTEGKWEPEILITI